MRLLFLGKNPVRVKLPDNETMKIIKNQIIEIQDSYAKSLILTGRFEILEKIVKKDIKELEEIEMQEPIEEQIEIENDDEENDEFIKEQIIAEGGK